MFDNIQIVHQTLWLVKEKIMNSEMFQYISKTLGYLKGGRLHNPKDQIGKVFTNADGQAFVVFKQTTLDPAAGLKAEPEAMFRVQFRVPKIMPWRDRLIITVKSPIFVALPGFRSKLWMVDEKNNTYQGVYEWDTSRNAEDYVHSASMDFMAGVAVAGGFSYEIIPGGKLVQKGANLSIGRNGAA
jgi:hypothetical protein